MFKEKTKNNILTLYHSSHRGLEGIIKPKSRFITDFGCGFYTGTFLKQAQALISEDMDGKLYKLNVNLEELSNYNFKNDPILWALYIGYNRNLIDHGLYKKLKSICEEIASHDVIIGKIVDDQIANVFTRFTDNTITSTALVECIKYLNLGEQYVFKTQKSCDAIRIVEESQLTSSQKSLLKRERNADLETISYKVEEIITRNRRSGLFADELLEDYK